MSSEGEGRDLLSVGVDGAAGDCGEGPAHPSSRGARERRGKMRDMRKGTLVARELFRQVGSGFSALLQRFFLGCVEVPLELEGVPGFRR